MGFMATPASALLSIRDLAASKCLGWFDAGVRGAPDKLDFYCGTLRENFSLQVSGGVKHLNSAMTWKVLSRSKSSLKSEDPHKG